MLSHPDCERIERAHGSPFYVLDRDAFVANFKRFEAAFRSRYDRLRIGYSYKTNYLPYLCRLARDLGGHAEVVSRLEYDLALHVGQDPARIIFNGPVKSREDIALALENGGAVHLDSDYELEHVLDFARRRPGVATRVGLRVNMDLSDETGASHVQEGLHLSRFGFPPEALAGAAERLRSAGVEVRALHGHVSSSTRRPWIYGRITQTLCRLAAEWTPDTIDDIDVGGGFYGTFKPGYGPADAPSYDDYAEAVVGALRGSPWAARRGPCLVLEPGVALVADVLSLVSRVVDVKAIRGRTLAVVDGSVFHSKPSQHKKPQPYGVIRGPGAAGEERLLSVTGSTCMEKDYLLGDVRAAVARGDFVRIDNVGAYTVTMSPTFIHPAPAVVVREGGAWRAVRERQTFEQAFAPCRI